MTRTVVTWLALAALAALLVYGLVVNGLFQQTIWAPEGLVRFACFCGGFAVASAVVLRFRPSEFGRILVSTALVTCVVFAGARPTLAVLFVFASAWALGRRFGLSGVLAMLAGVSVYAGAIGVLAPLPVHRFSVYFTVLAIPLVCEARHWRSWRWPKVEGTPWLALLALALGAHLLVALGPEVSADGLAAHLAIPASMAEHHRFVFDAKETLWAATPLTGDWGFTLAYVLGGGEAASRLFNFGLMSAIAAMVASLSTPLVAAVFASSPLVQLVTGSLFVENFWGSMIVGAFTAAVRGEAMCAALLLGTAVASKFGALAYVLPLLGVMAYRRRLSLACVAVLVIAAAPPYVNAWMRTGSPLYPYVGTKFGIKDPRFPTPPAGRALYDYTIHSSRQFEAQDGGFAFFPLLFLPMALVLARRRSDDPAWMALCVAVPAAALTLLASGNARYLYPLLPLIAVAGMRVPMGAAVVLVALQMYFLPASGGYHKGFFALTRAQVERAVDEGAPGKRMVAWLNQHHRGSTVLFVETNQIAGLVGKALTNTWHNRPFETTLHEAGTAEASREKLVAAGIEWLVTPQEARGIHHVALRRMVEQGSAVEYTAAGWQVRRLTNLAAKADEVLAPGKYDDSDTGIVYRGSWDSGEFSGPANGSITYGTTMGDRARVEFEGSGITWVYTRAFNRGQAEVWIDGVLREVVDQYSHEIEWQSRSTLGGLVPGRHVMEIRVLGKHAPGATDSAIDVDAIEVLP